MNITIEIAILLILILANGFLSMAEMALVSARKARLQQSIVEGDSRAQKALELAEQPGRFLSAVQIGITLIGILTGAVGGARLAASLAVGLSRSEVLRPYANAISFGVVIVATTYLSLVIGELGPKRLALNSAERIAAFVAPVMSVLVRITRPLEGILSGSTALLLRLLGVKPSDEAPVTDEEVRILIGQGRETGVFEPIEEEIVGQLFRLSDLNVGALITPRTEIAWLDLHAEPAEIVAAIAQHSFSRYPVAEDDLDNVTGLVMAKDLLAQRLAGRPLDLRSAMQAPLFIPDSMEALEALERLRETRTHIALVIDEYGGLEGLVTLTDFVEAIIGEVPDVGEAIEHEVVKRADGTYLVDGRLAIDRFQALFDLKELPEENEGYYQTLGGFVMAVLGRVPAPGDRFDWQQLGFEVMDMDGRRVDKVLVTPPSADDQTGE